MRVKNKYRDTIETTDVFIGRGAVFGNPFVINKHGVRTDVIAMYEDYLRDLILTEDPVIIKALDGLTDNSNLLCFCTPKNCHGSIVKKYYEEYKQLGICGFKELYSLYGPSTDGVDHINIGSSSKTEIGQEIYKLLVRSKVVLNTTIDKVQLASIVDGIKSFITDDVRLTKLLSDTRLPITTYRLLDGIVVRSTMGYWLSYQLELIRLIVSGRKKLIIAGSRTITDYSTVKKAYVDSGLDAGFIISGTAAGVDTFGEELAGEIGCRIIRFYPYWDSPGLNKSAGMYRNKQMAMYGDSLLAVYDGSSKGTADMIKIAGKEKCVVSTMLV